MTKKYLILDGTEQVVNEESIDGLFPSQKGVEKAISAHILSQGFGDLQDFEVYEVTARITLSEKSDSLIYDWKFEK